MRSVSILTQGKTHNEFLHIKAIPTVGDSAIMPKCPVVKTHPKEKQHQGKNVSFSLFCTPIMPSTKL